MPENDWKTDDAGNLIATALKEYETAALADKLVLVRLVDEKGQVMQFAMTPNYARELANDLEEAAGALEG